MWVGLKHDLSILMSRRPQKEGQIPAWDPTVHEGVSPFSSRHRSKAAPAGERDLGQGLAQECPARTHEVRGSEVGSDRLFE